MPAPRIYADFHNLDDSNRLRLTCAGTAEDLSRQGIELREGLPLTFYMDDADDQGQADDLLVEGITHYDQEAGCWVAAVDWTTLRHVSSEGPQSTGSGTAALPRLGVEDNPTNPCS
jgi:hypothetical protein